jgi:DNA-binding transcriptional ArsR family regulator
LSAIINEEEMTVEEFCEKHDISRSTVSRKLSALSKFLKRYKIRLTYTPIGILGDEVLIRFMLFYIFWIGVRNVEWPFAFSKDKVYEIGRQFLDHFSIQQGFLGERELAFLIGVFASRVSKGEFVEDGRVWEEIFKGNPFFEGLQLEGFPEMNDTQRANETNYLYMLGHFIPDYTTDNMEQIQQTIESFYHNKPEHPLVELNQRFMAFVEVGLSKGTWLLSNEDRDYLYANLINISFPYYVLNSPFADFEIFGDNFYSMNEVYKNMEQNNKFFLDKLLKEPQFARFRNSKEHLIRRYTNLLYPILKESAREEKLRVGIAIERNQVMITRLRAFIESLNFIQTELFTPEDVERYDVIISSSSEVKKQWPDITMFYWDIEYGQEELLKLYQFLQTKYMEKTA